MEGVINRDFGAKRFLYTLGYAIACATSVFRLVERS
jgi:hypothetical protein